MDAPPIGWLFRRRRQRNRIVRQRAQIGDDVGTLAVLRDASETHRGAGDEALGIGDELVQVVIGPGAALGLHRSREIEAAALTLVVADDAVEIGSDAVRTVLLEGMTGGALLRRSGALFDGSGLQQFLDRLGGRGGRFLAGTTPGLLGGNRKAWLFRLRRSEQRLGGKARHQQKEAGAEHGT